MSLRAWTLQVALLAIVFALIFGLVIGKRGITLALFVAVLSLLPPTLVWARRRAR